MKLRGEFTAKTFTFVDGSDGPHFLFVTRDGHARLYISETQAALASQDLASYIGNLIRSRQ